MRRLPLLLSFAIAVVAGTVVVELVTDRVDWIGFYKKAYQEKCVGLVDEAAFAKAYLLAIGNLDDLALALNNERKRGNLDFWLVYRGQDAVRHSDAAEDLALARFDLGSGGALQMTKQYSYVSRPMGGDYSIVVGLRYDEEHFFSTELAGRKGVILTFVGNLSIVIIAAFLFFFREISSLARELAGQTRSFARKRLGSREAALLAQGLAALERRSRDLGQERDRLRLQVLPSLRAELASGREPPYEFECALARTDINGFSMIFNTRPRDEFMATVDAFFAELSQAVARYGGLMHEFVGDEAIYYFKDDASGNSVAAALAAIREANAIASRINERVAPERGYPFTVKSTLAHGRLRYGQFLRGYNLAGAPLIESVRLLANVREKDGNVAVFASRHAERAAAVARLSPYGTVELKGFIGTHSLFRYDGHLPIESHFEAAASGRGGEQLAFYRSDADLVAILERARAEAQKPAGGERALRLLDGYARACELFASDGRPAKALLDWLEAELAAAEAFPATASEALDSSRSRRVSSLLAGVKNLVPGSLFDTRAEGLLRRGAALKRWPRAAANAIDAMAHFNLQGAIEMTQLYGSRLEPSVDARLEAVALQVRGWRELDRATLKGLRKMLRASDPRRRASALYAIGELAAYHRERDLVYFQSHLAFAGLVDSLPAFAADPEAMVRNQALVAARKAGDSGAPAGAAQPERRSQSAS
jgi:adenylate cyclase